ncbi:MAG: Hsp70 family protein [Myxococcota bacterium]
MKRLRVRLKASRLEEVADTFGHRLRSSGVRLPAKVSLPPETEVSVLLLYRDGSHAFEGLGRVLRCVEAEKEKTTFEMDLECSWSPASQAKVDLVLAEVHQSRMVTRPDLTSDLEATVVNPEPIPAPVDSTRDVLQVPQVPLLLGAPESSPDADPLHEPPDPSESNDWEMSPPPAHYAASATPPTLWDESQEAASTEAPAEALESGEVTPLARIELVRNHPFEFEGTPEPKPMRSIGSLPGQMDEPTLESKSRLVVGIDLGTAWIRTAAVVDERVQVVPTRRGLPSLPSVVHIEPSGKTIVGDPAARRAERTPEYGVRDLRRLMGHPHDSATVRSLAGRQWFQLVPGEAHEAAVRIGDFRIPLEEITALLLKEVREGCALVLPDRVNRSVLTAPGWAGPRTRASVARAGRLAGLHVERVVGEAAACAIAFAEANPTLAENVLIISMGAGHLDLGMAQVEGGRVRMRAVGGTPRLGGVDFDRALTPILTEAVEDVTGERPAETPEFWASVQTCARDLKEQLSIKNTATAELIQPLLNNDAFRLHVELTIEQAERMWAPLVDGVMEVVQQILPDGGPVVDRVLLAGCGLHLPRLRRSLRDLFPKTLWEELEPDAAATGAALLGDRIQAGREPRLIEVLAQPIRVASRSQGGWWIFDRGTEAPSERTFHVPMSHQQPDVVVLQGLAPDDREPVGRVHLPADAHGELRLLLRLQADLRLEAVVNGSAASLDPAVEPSRILPWAFENGGSNPSPASGGAPRGAGLFSWLKGRR